MKQKKPNINSGSKFPSFYSHPPNLRPGTDQDLAWLAVRRKTRRCVNGGSNERPMQHILAW